MKKKILITGGTGLLGSQLVKNFINDDCEVIFTARSEAKAKVLNKKVPKADFIIVDFDDAESYSSFKSCLKEKHMDTTCLINNARNINNLAVNSLGIASSKAMLDEYYMNVMVPYDLSNYFFKHSLKLKSIVNISSQYSLVAPNMNLYDSPDKSSPIQYNTSKASLNHLTKELAVRYLKKNIRVNCVAFGGFEGRASKDFVKRYSDISPGKRMLKIKEVYGPIKFLLEEESSSINGQTIIADAGWTLC